MTDFQPPANNDYFFLDHDQRVTFNSGVTPYTLTSEEAVLAAQAAGDVTVTRVPENDFKCPIQP